MPATLQAGYTTSVADGAQSNTGRMGRTNEQIFGMSGLGDFYEWVSRGKVYCACSQAAVTFGTALTATAVTFTLYNPAGSGFNLSLLHCGVTMITSTTAGSLVYAANILNTAAAPATNTALTVRNCKLDGAAGVGVAYSVTTLPAAPVAIRTFGSGFTTNANACYHDYVSGAILLAQNTAVTIQGITIVGTGLIDMCWAEIPV